MGFSLSDPSRYSKTAACIGKGGGKCSPWMAVTLESAPTLQLSRAVGPSSVLCPEMASNSPTESALPCFHGQSLRVDGEFFSSRSWQLGQCTVRDPGEEVKEAGSPPAENRHVADPRALGRAREAQTLHCAGLYRMQAGGPGVSGRNQESGGALHRDGSCWQVSTMDRPAS